MATHWIMGQQVHFEETQANRFEAVRAGLETAARRGEGLPAWDEFLLRERVAEGKMSQADAEKTRSQKRAAIQEEERRKNPPPTEQQRFAQHILSGRLTIQQTKLAAALKMPAD